MISRLLVVAAGPTEALRRGRFPSPDDELDWPDTSPEHPVRMHPALLGGRAAPVGPTGWCGPERSCRQTAARLGWTPAPDDALAGPDPGQWRGIDLRTLSEQHAEHLAAWAADPGVAPPGGESRHDTAARMARWAGARSTIGTDGPTDRTAVVLATPPAARTLVQVLMDGVEGAGAPVDVEPAALAVLTRSVSRWSLRALLPWPLWSAA
ncbi:histidine phosphatase family protein [Nakamurella leprariae]|uniref:Histidine phosphatase family protein n=1 Tax=Nakamurella leprariae TaxID=2803911 RepID=A0A938YEK2_9ACTN|nr:histidine phosphatase family protein [Nakamurella leprariae]MBM9468111.1 histidine phosphatase family protein [Nakamurella leprariae]